MPRKSKKPESPKPLLNVPEPEKHRVSDAEQVLIEGITRARTVIERFETCPAWKIVREDLEAGRRAADDVWHTISETDQEKLRELRISKMATKYVLDLVTYYDADLKRREEELKKFRNPETHIQADWDGEGSN